MSIYLEHHGILGQKWGKRNGPPYPLDESDKSARERRLEGAKKLAKNGVLRTVKYKIRNSNTFVGNSQRDAISRHKTKKEVKSREEVRDEIIREFEQYDVDTLVSNSGIMKNKKYKAPTDIISRFYRLPKQDRTWIRDNIDSDTRVILDDFARNRNERVVVNVGTAILGAIVVRNLIRSAFQKAWLDSMLEGL